MLPHDPEKWERFSGQIMRQLARERYPLLLVARMPAK
jgi:hypothetical protein